MKRPGCGIPRARGNGSPGTRLRAEFPRRTSVSSTRVKEETRRAVPRATSSPLSYCRDRSQYNSPCRIIYCENQTRLTASWLDKRRHWRSVNHHRGRASPPSSPFFGVTPTTYPPPRSLSWPPPPPPPSSLRAPRAAERNRVRYPRRGSLRGPHTAVSNTMTWEHSRSHRRTSRTSVYGPVGRGPILSTCYLPRRVPRSLSTTDFRTTPLLHCDTFSPFLARR